ncbi:hypothetical protein KL924_004579, partial [Ogataea haglerorum]
MSPSDARLGANLKEVLNYERVVCMLSGADATDTATKIARKWGYKVKGIPIDQAFALTTCACYHGLKISTHSFDVKPDPLFGPYVPHQTNELRFHVHAIMDLKSQLIRLMSNLILFLDL